MTPDQLRLLIEYNKRKLFDEKRGKLDDEEDYRRGRKGLAELRNSHAARDAVIKEAQDVIKRLEVELKVALARAAVAYPTSGDAAPRPPTQRELELAYLDRLRFDDFRLEKFELAEYASLGGVVQTRHMIHDEWDRLAMEQEFAVIKLVKRGEMEIDAPPEKFTDAVSKIIELRRVVVLGEPGAGKTHTLRALAKPLYNAALNDPTAPIPLLVKLGNWDKLEMPFEGFLRGALGGLGAHLDELVAAKRAILLFDGLNEFPADQRTAKYPQVEAYIKAHPDAIAVVTCREADYPISLHLNKVLIRPLDPLRIRDFARRVLRLKGESEGDTFFWKLIGTEAQRFEARFKALFANTLSDWEAVFWTADMLPPSVKWEGEFINGWYIDWYGWRALRDNAAAILTLARNPYMLRMLLDVYIQSKGELPTNRGQLFDKFVMELLRREHLVDKETEALTEEGRVLLNGLQRIAYEMQIHRVKQQKISATSAGTSLDLAVVRDILDERLLYLAVSTSILTTDDKVRFSHQLLQEYFAARYLHERVFSPHFEAEEADAKALQASDIWKPANWWERTNWEEAAILLAGLYSDNCTPVLDWLADANPEVAALCIARSGAYTPEETKRRLRDVWLLRLNDLTREPEPRARAAVGRALGLFTIDQLPADNRKGVSVMVRDGIKLPIFDWITIPAGKFRYGDDKRKMEIKNDFQISLYPVTYAQFQAFIDDGEGFYDPRSRWWEGLAIPHGHNDVPGEQAYKYWNHPRENVSWYEAMAFCRWLSWRLDGGYKLDKIEGWAVRLPTEYEWEKAARGKDGRIYPYAVDFDAGKGNTQETGIGQTSAVGIFPDGASPFGVLDMSGNVWDWCLTAYAEPAPEATKENLHSDVLKVLRGGSWNYYRNFARSVYRLVVHPDLRNDFFGFRLVRAPSQ